MNWFNRKLLTFLIVGMAILLPGCWQSDKDSVVSSRIVIANVLDQGLYQDCRIPSSVHVALDKVDEFANKLDKDIEIVVYCSNYLCTSSDFVAEQLKELGFTNVKIYQAGMAEWFQQGYPVEGPAKSPYLTKVIEKPIEDEKKSVQIITTQELAQKLNLKSLKK